MRTRTCPLSPNLMLLTLPRLACPIINILSRSCPQEAITLLRRRTPTAMLPMGLHHPSLLPIQVAQWDPKYNHKV